MNKQEKIEKINRDSKNEILKTLRSLENKCKSNESVKRVREACMLLEQQQPTASIDVYDVDKEIRGILQEMRPYLIQDKTQSLALLFDELNKLIDRRNVY